MERRDVGRGPDPGDVGGHGPGRCHVSVHRSLPGRRPQVRRRPSSPVCRALERDELVDRERPPSRLVTAQRAARRRVRGRRGTARAGAGINGFGETGIQTLHRALERHGVVDRRRCAQSGGFSHALRTSGAPRRQTASRSAVRFDTARRVPLIERWNGTHVGASAGRRASVKRSSEAVDCASANTMPRGGLPRNDVRFRPLERESTGTTVSRRSWRARRHRALR